MFLTLNQIPRIVEIGRRWERKFLLSGKAKYKKDGVGLRALQGK